MEEISLGKATKQESNVPQKSEVVKADTDDKLRELAQKATNNSELLDAILAAPADQLLPWEETTLPSKGLYYGWSSDVVGVRPYGMAVDKILANQRMAQSGKSIEHILKTCCRFPKDFDVSDLLVGDQVFLLYYLRGITHGNIYEFAIPCRNPDCKSTIMKTVDLNDLAQTIRWADSSLGSEPFQIELPYLTERLGKPVWVQVRFLRVKDATSIAMDRKSKQRDHVRNAGINRKTWNERHQEVEEQIVADDDLLSKNIERLIVSILGDTDPFRRHNFVEKLHQMDLATIREWIADNSPGLDTTVDVSCVDCGSEFQVMLPITPSFFRPQKPRGV